MKMIVTALAGALLATPTYADTWAGESSDGIKQAFVGPSEETQILVLCDVGVNAPITSINFMINGTAPMPNSNVRLQFDKEDPIFMPTDVEGGIGSLTASAADQFEQVVSLLKSKSSVNVRLFDGSEHSFRLRGSSKAIGACPSDYSRYQLASN